MECFLHARAQEIVYGGLMILIIPGYSHGTPLSHSMANLTLQLLGSCLVDMTKKASHVLSSGDHFERNELIEAEGNNGDDTLCVRYLAQVDDILAKDASASDVSCVESLKEPSFSRMVLRLVEILSSFRLQENMKCIIFVNRIVTASSLSYILQNLKFLASWKCDFLVGVHSGLKSMSRKKMNIILDKFLSGKLNLLVATKVGEEGLDVQTCCLVIQFDLPETVSSFIQSRGRARMPTSEHACIFGEQWQPKRVRVNRKLQN